MTPFLSKESMRLSVMTIAILKDTGFWEDINENLTDLTYWGKNQGCDFLNKSCKSPNKFTEFQNEKGCSFSYEGAGDSKEDPTTD